MGRAHGKAGPAAGVGENPQNPGFSWLLKIIRFSIAPGDLQSKGLRTVIEKVSQ